MAAPVDGPPTVHLYVSTSCMHARHDYCQRATGAAGSKIPAVCKFCRAKCLCPCHREDRDGDD